MANSPIVFCIYNRDQNFVQIINAISKIKPKLIFIVADGPKDLEDQVKVERARLTIEKLITWKCVIKKNYSPTNLGLKERFRTGISWVFEHADRAIFIEDDCIPDPSFFRFCDELLEKYKDDERIFSIAGNNFQPKANTINDSYYLSRYPHVWGWATWKRVWDEYDSDISDWPKLKNDRFLNKIYPDHFFIRKFWTYIFDRLNAGRINTWDYQLTYLSLKNSGFNIIPNINLVSNVGYGEDATNIKNKNKTIAVPTSSISFPIKHPKNISCNDSADRHIEELVYLHPLGKVSLFIKSILGLV